MKGKDKKAGVMSGLSSQGKFQASPDVVSTPTGGNQAPVKKATKHSGHKIQ